MEEHDQPRLQTGSSLPKPVVLRPEDLASVAAAAGATSAVFAARVIIAGGIPVAPNMGAMI